MTRLLSTTFRYVKPRSQFPTSPATKSSSSSNSTPSPSSVSVKSESNLNWSVYLILSTNPPIRTYVGVTNNFTRRTTFPPSRTTIPPPPLPFFSDFNQLSQALHCRQPQLPCSQDDAKLLTLLQSEIKRQSEEKDEFDIDAYMASLMTSCFGRFLLWSPRLPSTQDVVSLNFCEIPVGSVCIADVQFKGRGRSQNIWESPKGGLLFSFTIQMEDGRMVPLLQYVICLAVTEAIKDLSLKNGVPPLDVRIKWPNDLYLDGLKVGGILCTSTYRSKKFNISAGVGLNVDNDKPTTSLNAALRKLNSGYQLQREEITTVFFNKFEHLFHIFIKQGFQPLEEQYYKTWLHSGQRIVVQEKSEDHDLLTENNVTVQGLTSSGYLLAIADNGEMCELHPDGNSFDFFKGLVRRKLT